MVMMITVAYFVSVYTVYDGSWLLALARLQFEENKRYASWKFLTP